MPWVQLAEAAVRLSASNSSALLTCGDLPEDGVRAVSAGSLLFGCIFMLWQIRRAYGLAHRGDEQGSACCPNAEDVEHEHDDDFGGIFKFAGDAGAPPSAHGNYGHVGGGKSAALLDAEADAAALEAFRLQLVAEEAARSADGNGTEGGDGASRSSCLPALCQPHQMIFPLYYTFMKIASMILLVRGVLFIIGSRTDYFSVANLLFVNPVGACLEEGVAFFLSRASAGEGAVRQTMLFASCWFVVQFGLGLGMMIAYGIEAASLVNFVPTKSFDIYWISFDVLKTSFYGVALAHSVCREQSRPHSSLYALFNMLCYGTSLFGDVLLTAKSDAAPCILLCTWAVWDAFWPLAVYYTLLADSNWWSSLLLPKASDFFGGHDHDGGDGDRHVRDDSAHDYSPPEMGGASGNLASALENEDGDDDGGAAVTAAAAAASASQPLSLNDDDGARNVIVSQPIAMQWTFAPDGTPIGVPLPAGSSPRAPPRKSSADRTGRDTSAISIVRVPASSSSSSVAATSGSLSSSASASASASRKLGKPSSLSSSARVLNKHSGGGGATPTTPLMAAVMHGGGGGSGSGPGPSFGGSSTLFPPSAASSSVSPPSGAPRLGTSLSGRASPTAQLAAFGPHGAPIVYPADLVIPYDQLRFGRAIGSGGTATVYRGHWRNALVAIKSFKCEMLTKEYVARFAQEMVFASTLHDQNVVRCLGICVVPPSICIVTEFMERGSLFRVLSVEARALSYRRRVAMAVDACAGIAFLHRCTPPIIHRDIKSLNFLVDREYRVKLADLGEARELSSDIVDGQSHLTKNRGTPHWMAPEVFLGANYDERVDVYSLGIVMWEIITSRRPFEDVSPWLIPAAVVERRQRPALPEWIPAPYAELISAAWAQDHTQRPSAQQLLECLHALLERAPADDSWPTA